MKPTVVRPPVGDNVPEARLYYGVGVVEGLRQLAEASIHTVCTSPPYWGLRSYGTDPVIFGGHLDCQHQWDGEGEGSSCVHCGAWRGHLGLEPSPEMYVEHLVGIFREVARVLRPDGLAWLNLGDTYCAASTYQATRSLHTERGWKQPDERHQAPNCGLKHAILKPKDLVGIPWRVALALQADGWYLRSVCPWVKRNVMPESVRDRPTSASEYIFMLAHPDSGSRYYYDPDAVRIAHKAASLSRFEYGLKMQADERAIQHSRHDRIMAGLGTSERMGDYMNAAGRNRRNTDWFFESVAAIADGEEGLVLGGEGEPEGFVVNPRPYPGAHFAVWPPKLVGPMVASSTSEHGVCPDCGAPWRRMVEGPDQSERPTRGDDKYGASRISQGWGDRPKSAGQAWQAWRDANPDRTVGWEPSCTCGAPEGLNPEDLEMIRTPVGSTPGRSDFRETGRPRPARDGDGEAWQRPRSEDEGVRLITQYERREYAAQLRASPEDVQARMRDEVGDEAFAHYRKPGSVSGRPIPQDALERWIERGWLTRVDPPRWEPLAPTRPVVLDPFSGSGTTGMVALQMGRDFVGIDLGAEYLDLAVARIMGTESRKPRKDEEDDPVAEMFGE